MPTLYIFKGPPATGKSTRRAEMIAADPSIGYVNKDELRELFPDDLERRIHERQQMALDSYAREGRSIIIDNTNLNPRTVQGYTAWAQRHGYDVQEMVFGADVPYEVAVQRDRERGRKGGRTVGASVIWQFYVDAGLVPVPRPEHRTKVYLFDIDGTLATIDHRRHFVQGDQKDWRSFNAAMAADTVNAPVKAMYDIVRRQHATILMSGRGSEFRAVTERWLGDHEIWLWSLLLMRGYGDSRQDAIIKRELYEKYVAPFYEVLGVFDDRDQVVAMWRELGLTCFQVAPGDF